jgi:hypothetical protein
MQSSTELASAPRRHVAHHAERDLELDAGRLGARHGPGPAGGHEPSREDGGEDHGAVGQLVDLPADNRLTKLRDHAVLHGERLLDIARRIGEADTAAGTACGGELTGGGSDTVGHRARLHRCGRAKLIAPAPPVPAP